MGVSFHLFEDFFLQPPNRPAALAVETIADTLARHVRVSAKWPITAFAWCVAFRLADQASHQVELALLEGASHAAQIAALLQPS
jgi:hypothetical protein